jgi:2,4-dienoyl-CoA reductase-like NADH-dependent reductase (Old Yellow Enzyme family)
VRPFARLTQRPVEPIEAYNVPAAEAVKQAVAIPVIVVGGVRSVDQMRSILSTGQADFIAMSRPFIREPGLVRKLREGRQPRASCTSCGVCVMATEREPLRCHDGRVRPVHQSQRR